LDFFEKWLDNGLSPLAAMRISAPEGRTFINATTGAIKYK
jgi:hypothetical protein